MAPSTHHYEPIGVIKEVFPAHRFTIHYQDVDRLLGFFPSGGHILTENAFLIKTEDGLDMVAEG